MIRRCRVLVVDDQPAVRGATARLLSLEFDVAEAGSLEAARLSLALAAPDVLVTDLDLGNGDRGEELLLEARSLYPSIDRIVLSGSPDRIEAIGGLAALVFQKGAFQPLEFIDAIRAICRGRRDERDQNEPALRRGAP